MAATTVPLQIRLDPEVHAKLAELAAKHQRSMAGEVRWLIDQHLAAAE